MRVELALEAALALPATAVAVPHIPTNLAGLGDPLLVSAIAAPQRSLVGTRRQQLRRCATTPVDTSTGSIRLAKTQRSTSTGSNLTNRPIFRYGTRRSSTKRRTNRAITPGRQAVDVEQRVRHLLGAAMAGRQSHTGQRPTSDPVRRMSAAASPPSWYIRGTST
jgi:hypothetical protein